MLQGAAQVFIAIAITLSDPVAERYRLLQWDRLRPYTCGRRLFAPREV